VLAEALVCALLGGCLFDTEEAERRVEEAKGVGETQLFEIASRHPLTWVSDDRIRFLTWFGTATIDISTGAVTEQPDPSLRPPNPHPERDRSAKLPAGARFGPWEVTGDSRFLVADDSGDVRCGALLVSPNGEYVACHYIVTDRMAESSTGGAAVIRLR
jgi:hypothetical protein